MHGEKEGCWWVVKICAQKQRKLWVAVDLCHVVCCFMIAVETLITKYMSSTLPRPEKDYGIDKMHKSRVELLKKALIKKKFIKISYKIVTIPSHFPDIRDTVYNLQKTFDLFKPKPFWVLDLYGLDCWESPLGTVVSCARGWHEAGMPEWHCMFLR